MTDETPLTPYDTGEVLEPKTWAKPTDTRSADWGKVDFENDESATDLTLRVVVEDGRLVVKIDTQGIPVWVEIDGVLQ